MDQIHLWVRNEPKLKIYEKFLTGFALSDKCYDVWIPNTRGTRYSNRHVNLTTHDRAFWNFSYDELAKYDMKANIDYVVNVTGSSKIQYVGFSQVIFFI